MGQLIGYGDDVRKKMPITSPFMTFATCLKTAFSKLYVQT